MVKSMSVYLGDKHCAITHEPSQNKIETDAPKDNGGRGASFSPTDLVGAALGSCIITTMAMVAEREGIPFGEARAEVGKEMTANPRFIGRLTVKITLSQIIPQDKRARIEEVAHTCPVHRSLGPQVQIPVSFEYV